MLDPKKQQQNKTKQPKTKSSIIMLRKLVFPKSTTMDYFTYPSGIELTGDVLKVIRGAFLAFKYRKYQIVLN